MTSPLAFSFPSAWAKPPSNNHDQSPVLFCSYMLPLVPYSSGVQGPASTVFWAQFTAGLVATVGTVVFLVDLYGAPVGYEDDEGFHFGATPESLDSHP